MQPAGVQPLTYARLAAASYVAARRRIFLFALLRSSAPVCGFAQPEHHRLFPSAGSLKLGAFSWQLSHIFLFA
jgi:hypothetical protein